MKRRLHYLLIVGILQTTFLFAEEQPAPKRFGAYATLDLCYGTKSRLFQESVDRKFSFGLSINDRKKRFQLLVGVGAKVIKPDIVPYRFSDYFMSEVKYRYAPIHDTSESQLIASIVHNGQNLKMGTVNYYLHLGFILHHKLQPSFHFYYGEQLTIIKDQRLSQYTDPKYGDYYQVEMNTRYYEFKLGMTIPFKFLRDKPYCYTIHAGYRFMDHNDVSFGDTPLSAYTRYNLTAYFHRDAKWLFGITFNIWSNWKSNKKASSTNQ